MWWQMKVKLTKKQNKGLFYFYLKTKQTIIQNLNHPLDDPVPLVWLRWWWLITTWSVHEPPSPPQPGVREENSFLAHSSCLHWPHFSFNKCISMFFPYSLVSHLSCFPFQVLHWKHLLSEGQCHHRAVLLECQVLHLQGEHLGSSEWAETPGSAFPTPKFTRVTPGLPDKTFFSSSSSSHIPSFLSLQLPPRLAAAFLSESGSEVKQPWK